LLTTEDWHHRYLIQARWTAAVREYLYPIFILQDCERILEVGCGTAVITKEISSYTSADIFGLDILPLSLNYAREYNPGSHFCCGDAVSLPFLNDAFNLAFCHFLLLWLHSPGNTLSEMRRVTHPGGIIAALAEPDYGGRIDYPGTLGELGQLQTDALRTQGADPFIGRKLRALFHHAGLMDVQVGVIGGQWNDSPVEEEYLSERDIIHADLKEILSDGELGIYETEEKQARENHSRILFVPTFYAWGRVP
jgi:SAM-dependent methyltransferase